jgi:rhodanese-related sulfurtransferase
VLGILLGLFLLYKYVERRRHRATLALPRIDTRALQALFDGGHDPLLIDARSATAQQLDAAIAGALVYTDCEPMQLMASLDKDRHIVVYCSCPNDVTAAQVAKTFLANGFHRARPLQGGLDAWRAHCAEIA